MASNNKRIAQKRTEQMFALIKEWHESEVSQKEFYTQHGIKPHVFWYWLGRWKKDQQAKKEAPGFVPIEVKQGREEAVMAEIIYDNGTRLVLKERVGLQFLQGLLPKV